MTDRNTIFQNFDAALDKTNQDEFDGYIDKRINQDLLENLSKEECRKLLIDYLVHLGLEKIQTNPLDIAAKHEMQSKDVNGFMNKLQSTPQKVDDLPLLLAGWYRIPPAVARLVAKNIIEDKNMEIYTDNTGQKCIKLQSTLL